MLASSHRFINRTAFKNGYRHYLASGLHALQTGHWGLTGDILQESVAGRQPQPLTWGLAQAGFTSRDSDVSN